MPETFGLTGRDLRIFEAISLAAGQASLWQLSDGEAGARLIEIFETLSFDELGAERIADAFFTQCQNVLLGQDGCSPESLRRLAPFNRNNKSTLTALLDAYCDGGDVELFATYTEIFEDPDWIKGAALNDHDRVIFDLQIAAYEEYKTVEHANYLIDQLGGAYVSRLSSEEFLEWIEVRRTRPGLDDQGKLGLIISSVACGDLAKVNLNEQEAYGLLEIFLDQTLSKGDGPRQIDGFIAGAQNALMAYRREDFLYIQLEPPFRAATRLNLHELHELWNRHGVEAVREKYREIVNQACVRTSDDKIRVLGGSGASPHDPIKLSTNDVEKRVRAENWYMNYRFGPRDSFWTELMHTTVLEPGGGRLLSTWNVELQDGSRRTVYFDTNHR